MLSLFRGPARPNRACVRGRGQLTFPIDFMSRQNTEIWTCSTVMDKLLQLADRGAAERCWNSFSNCSNITCRLHRTLAWSWWTERGGWQQICHWVGSMGTIHAKFIAGSDPWHPKAQQHFPPIDTSTIKIPQSRVTVRLSRYQTLLRSFTGKSFHLTFSELADFSIFNEAMQAFSFKRWLFSVTNPSSTCRWVKII